MRRFLTIAGLIAAILVVFFGLALWKIRANRPEVLLEKLRRGRGDKEELKMKLKLSRGDIIPGMIAMYNDRSADLVFRADMLELLFSRYRRSSDQRILPVLREALASSETLLRRTAVTYFDMYGGVKEHLYLLDRLDDPDPQIRRQVLITFTSRGMGGRGMRGMRGRQDTFWPMLSDQQRKTLVENCSRKMRTEKDPDLRFLARAVVGREINFLCEKAYETVSTAEFEKGERLLKRALELDADNHQARIRMARHFLAAGMKKKALELAEKYNALLRIPLLKSVPTIDGDPTDRAWDGAFRYVDKPFYHTTSRWASKRVEGKTDFYIGHRDGTIYIAVLGYEEDLNKLTVRYKTRDSDVFKDDCVELFFDPGCSEKDVYQFIVNPIGALHDDSSKSGARDNFVCQRKAKIFHDRGYWAMEFAVAAKDLHDQTIAADSIWGINIIRARIGPASEHCAYWPTFGWAHRYHLLALAVFDGLEKSTSAPAATQPTSKTPGG